ncbi:N-acetyltransferase B complex non catalytic subunit-domain-containing protein [Durotheca rogersii]|uniref:N-acetyltransferase B complex non catalytic subunit-domain-containing protein n=1 Tax=Durotheca rogersii TaxID=419775 RepID=UPI002220D7DE|nr:N-acetyltransferase B complex non catalytic subunit-domain-containing protein [Durotheca rogersii]KAI5859611.1 N-acetyltransferase B complex non catalytic subunit-domain-containing protein [Durotheca rogersii]
MVKDGTIIKDVDTLDLYEFACSRIDINYSETIGVLRLRLVKALPKDQNSCARCFDACVWNYDWKSAQQIAASLHKNSKDVKFLFQYILTTHVYSLSSECPDDKRGLFGNLAKALADKAFDLRAKTSSEDHHLEHASITEPEALLWVNVRTSHCKLEENLSLFRQHKYGPLTFLENGLDQPFSELMLYLKSHEAWDDLFKIGTEILDTAIRISQEEADAIDKDENVINLRRLTELDAKQGVPAVESPAKKNLAQAIEKARPMRKMKDNFYVTACCNWSLFTGIFEAAKHLPDRKRALKQVRQLFDRLIKAMNRAGTMKHVFQTTRDIVALATLFERCSRDLSVSECSTRVCFLINYIVPVYNNPLCFDRAMMFIRDMNGQEIEAFIELLYDEAAKSTDTFKRLTLLSLKLKIEYFVATLAKPTDDDDHGIGQEDSGSVPCLMAIADNALDLYQNGMGDSHLRRNRLPFESVDPLSDIAVVGTMCLLRLAGLGRNHRSRGMRSPLFNTDQHLFFQAVLWLDSYVLTSPPKYDSHRMLLTKLYILMGCVSRATALWDGFDVKNAINDSLGLLYTDRLSSIAPGLFILGSIRNNPVEPIIHHFTRALRRTLPSSLIDCLDQGTYSSVQPLLQRASKQTLSCTLSLAVVEERRGSRLRSGKIESPIEDHPLVRKLTIQNQLKDSTDYEILPKLDGRNSVPIREIVSYGPLPSNARGHLGLLAERLLDFVCYVQPKEYKPSRAGQLVQLDWEYALATSGHLHENLGIILGIKKPESPEDDAYLEGQQDRAAKSLTGPEASYYVLLWELSRIVNLVLKHITLPLTSESREHIGAGVRGVVENFNNQAANFLTPIYEGIESKVHIFHGFVDLHAMGMQRESILAVKYTVNYLTLALDKIRSADKTRASNEGGWLLAELKKMAAAAAGSENALKSRIKMLKGSLEDLDGWKSRLHDWTFGDYAGMYDENREWKKTMGQRMRSAISEATVDAWSDEVGLSWQDLMKGWAAVKFD